MRHHRSGKKLGRDSAHRKALYSNLTGSLIEYGRIKTTVAKAKAVRPIAEKMITLGRRGDLAARRQALAYLRSNDVVHILFAEVAPRFTDRPGGYTRIVKLGPRAGGRGRDGLPRVRGLRGARSGGAPGARARGAGRGSHGLGHEAQAHTPVRRHRLSRLGGPAGARTVEGEVRRALGGVFPTWSELAVAGRTDTGVHALANVASVEVDGGPPPERAAEALNAELPSDVAVSSVERAPPDSTRRSAVSRAYRYRVYRRREPSPFEERRSWWYPRPLDEEALAESADLLVGEHDFRAFTPAQTKHKVFVRVVKNAAWHRRERDARARDRGGQLPPAHGSHAGRDDDRAVAGGARATAHRRRSRPRRSRARLHPGASTWSAWC